MTRKLHVVNLIMAVIVATFFMVGCGNNSTGSGGSVEDGNLKGSSWERKDSYSSSVSAYDYTWTVVFTSNDAGKLTQKGWYQMKGSSTSSNKKENVDKEWSFTYVYSNELGEGVVENCSYFNIKAALFSFSSDYRTLNLGSAKYNRK